MTDVIAAARYVVRKAWPYLAPAVRALRPVPSPGLQARVGGPIGVTARGVLLYDPDTIATWTPEQLAAVLAGHEILHRQHLHHERAAAFGDKLRPKRWNIAADCAINEVTAACLQLVGADWPVTPVRAAGFNLPTGMTAEWYYERLPSDAGGNETGKADPEACDVMGNPLAPEDAALDAEHGHNDATMRQVAAETAERIRTAGNVPGALRAAFPPPTPKRTPWQQLLRRALTTAARKAGMSDLTWARPSRLQPALGYAAIMPAWVGRVRKVACYVDTSGSMRSPRTLAAVGGEVDGLLKHLGCPTLVAACDTRIHGRGHAKTFAEANARGIFHGGGGGTDFRPIFADLRKLPATERPSIVVVVTDGEGPAPAAPPPGVHTIWLLVGGSSRPSTWGTYVQTDL